MAEPAYLQLIASFWEWVKQDINTWFRALGNLKEVLAEHDLQSEDTIRFSLRFSAMSIIIAMLVDLPAKAFFAPQSLTVLYAASSFILYYVMIFVYAISLKIASFILISHTPCEYALYCL
jgi:hypothetical protein